jgi:ATP-binding cassette subfamily A (ABC1) protein 3
LSCLRGFSAKPIPPKAQNLTLDPDVIAEEERVRNNTNDVIRVCDFRKAYTTSFGEPFLAVERISFGLDYGECFALLGVNGAGKSTTFKSLTADTEPSEGEITVAGYNITTEFEGARKLIGYCPQKDAIFPLMTVEEHLWFYARIKGIPSHLHNDIVEKAIVELNLADHREKPAGTLSGGNKRKLSVAMATLGNPPIILLDEPSAGMDPEARRFMWTVVERISQRDKKSAVILTTHSMEEAEALSTKMGIMVRGGIFKCYGSSQHIKNKYGTGYECEIKIRKATYAELEEAATK